MRNLMLLMILNLFIISCSSSAIKPTEPMNPVAQFTGNIPVGVSDRFPDGTPSGGFGVMGLFTLDISADELRAELNPIRSLSLTDTLEVVDITNFLMLAPCTNCAKIKSVALDPDGNLIVTIGIKHPFPAGDPFKPITGRNRADLHVFNVEGILAAQGTSTTAFPILEMATSSVNLLNASGFTSYLDEVLDDSVFETDANLHPYILHFADYSQGNFDPLNPMGFESVVDPPPSGNLVMAQGCDYDYRDYIFDIDEDITYTYAIGCTYGVATMTRSERFNPEYRIPQHLKKAASEVHVIPPTEKLKEMLPDEAVTFQVQVVDRSHGVEVGENLDQMLADSSVSSVIVEIPGILMSTISQDGNASISGTGHDPADPLVYEFTISNEQIATVGVYPGLVKVIDSYESGMNGSPLLNGMDGIKRVDPLVNPLTGLFDIDEFATYAKFSVEVELGYLGSDPVAHITRSNTGCAPVEVTFDASSSTDADDDPLGIPLNFEFDFEYDGTIFTVDRPMSIDPIATHIYEIARCYTAAVRVTDSDGNQDIATVVVPIGDFSPKPFDSDITDGTSITDIDFIHGSPTFVGDINWPGMSYPTKGTARGDGYIYTVFYGVQGMDRCIFFSRSDNDSETWSPPIAVRIYDAQGQYSGCSIAADDTGQVLIVWDDHYHRDVGLEYSADHGDTWSSKLIRDEPDGAQWCYKYRMPDAAIDPTNPDNIIVASLYCDYGDIDWSPGWDQMYVCYSSTGPEGVFGEVLYVTHEQWHPGWVANVYKINTHYAIDGDAYIIAGENNCNFIYRSSDNGATWPDDAEHHVINDFDGWHRDFDSAMDPTNPDVFYIVRTLRSPWSPSYPVILHKATDGLHPTVIQNNINDNTSAGVYRFCPSVTVNDAGVVYVMWHTNESGDYDIMADYSCNGGTSFNVDVQFNTIDAGNEVDADLIPNACGDGVICVWEQNGNNPNGKLVSKLG